MNNSAVDLLIIGGGINGAGIARDAAGRGLSVALCEQGDLASATSSASSKLIHGGLRYLETGQFRLVHESLTERETLLSIAPHLMHPTRFVIPHTPQLRPAWMMRLGLSFYDWLGGWPCTFRKRIQTSGRHSLPAAQTIDLTTSPYGQALQADYKTGFVYSDVQTDDARLVILNLRDAAERGVALRLDRPTELLRVTGDEERLVQVLANLLGNALRFTERGGQVTLGARRNGNEIEIHVRDNGAGIPASELGRIFERYWTVRRNAPKGGTGLGLAIARGIVEAHGGRLWAESTPGVGSTFRFTVPVG